MKCFLFLFSDRKRLLRRILEAFTAFSYIPIDLVPFFQQVKEAARYWTTKGAPVFKPFPLRVFTNLERRITGITT